MYERLKKLLAETSIYTIGNVFLRSFSIITMPIFTRFMSTSQYGVLSIVRTVRDLFAVLYEAGTSASSMRLFYECENLQDEQRLFSTLFFFTTGLGVLLSIVLTVLGAYFWPLIIKEIPFYPYGTLTIFTVLMMTAGILPRTLFRAKGLAKRFVLLNFLQALFIVVISVLLVVIYDMQALGPIIATFGVSILFSVVYFKYLKPYLRFAFSWSVVKQSLAFGLPESPVRFGNWALKMANQIILQYYVPLSLIGIYSVGYAVGSIIFELTMSGVHSAILPFYYQTAKEETQAQAKQIFAYVAAYTLVLILFLSLFTVLMGKTLLLLFASAKYGDAYPVVILIAVSCIFQFLFFIPSRGLYIMKRTMLFPPLLFVTVGVNVLLSFILIPKYGIIGAAWATLISYCVRSILTFIVSQRIFYVPYLYMKMGRAVLVFGILLLAGTHLPEWHTGIQILLKTIILILFPALLYLFGFFEKKELTHIRSQCGASLKRLFSPLRPSVCHR